MEGGPSEKNESESFNQFDKKHLEEVEKNYYGLWVDFISVSCGTYLDVLGELKGSSPPPLLCSLEVERLDLCLSQFLVSEKILDSGLMSGVF